MSLCSQSASKWLLILSAIVLAAGGSLHALAYAKASEAADHSTLPPFFQSALKGLWLSDSLSSLSLAVALAGIAAYPRLAAKPLVLVLALTPVASAAALFSTMGNFFAGYLMLIAAASALLGATLRPADTEHWERVKVSGCAKARLHVTD
jgi:hypothetical protein